MARRRRTEAGIVAVLALCSAALFLSDDLSFLEMMSVSLPRILSAEEERGRVTPYLPSSGDSEVVGAQVAVYFLPADESKRHNKRKHPLEHYQSGLGDTCSFMQQLGHPATALGDHDFIRSVPNCEGLEYPGGGMYSQDELPHEEEAAVPAAHMCRRKFGLDKHDIRRITKEILMIYFNRFEALCDLAENQPDAVTVLLDADLDDALYERVQLVIEKRLLEPSDHTLTVHRHPDYPHRSWFGRDACHDSPTAKADFLAVRGRDCGQIRQEYRRSLEDLAAHGRTLTPGIAKGCPCYDDEKVLEHMNELNPGILSFGVDGPDEEEEDVTGEGDDEDDEGDNGEDDDGGEDDGDSGEADDDVGY